MHLYQHVSSLFQISPNLFAFHSVCFGVALKQFSSSKLTAINDIFFNLPVESTQNCTIQKKTRVYKYKSNFFGKIYLFTGLKEKFLFILILGIVYLGFS